MDATDPKTYLWATLCRLAELPDAGVDEMHRAVRKVVGRGTVQRIKQGETSVGLDALRELATVFQLEVWELLMPGIDRAGARVPAAAAPFSDELIRRLAAASDSEKRQAENAARNVLDLDPLPRVQPSGSQSGGAITEQPQRDTMPKLSA